MIPFRRMRPLAAVALALCLGLPAYTCSGYRTPTGGMLAAIPEGADSSQYTWVKRVYYPLSGIPATRPWFWAVVAAYTWPLIVLGVHWRRPESATSRIIRWAEPVLAVGTGLVLYSYTVFNKAAIGTYIAWAAIAWLLVSSVAELGRAVHLRSTDDPPAGASDQRDGVTVGT